ncbi:beta-class carbonic anhydrase [Zhaonella formicivorans]|uniref:beta-class carbonic anhydrase n=1 Tax=Zhaonella formicivorans TaxID=2528593 RepID=UPI0010F259A3|nr:carbonic anhydrase [Zhaonella formicivorans]
MNILEKILEANRHFVENLPKEFAGSSHEAISKIPSRQLAIFTCMDTRLVEFLEPAMGIKRGEAKVIKNAGNSVTGPFEATIRSLVVGIFELGVKEVMVVGHKDCGIANATAEGLIEKMLQRGISPDAIKMIEDELTAWLDQFHHPEDNVQKVVAKIRSNPLIPDDVPIHGLIFDPHSGKLEVLVNGYQETKQP